MSFPFTSDGHDHGSDHDDGHAHEHGHDEMVEREYEDDQEFLGLAPN